jgi:hypothetical protein
MGGGGGGKDSYMISLTPHLGPPPDGRGDKELNIHIIVSKSFDSHKALTLPDALAFSI